MSYSKGRKVFIGISVMIVIIGLIGFLVPYGDEKWNFIFENLMWFPIELSITVFILEKILNKVESEKKQNESISRFLKVSGIRTEDLIKEIYDKLFWGYSGVHVTSWTDSKKELTEIKESPKKLIDLESFDREISIIPFGGKQLYNKFQEMEHFSYPQSILKVSKEIDDLVSAHIREYSFTLTDELIDEFRNLRDVFQKPKILNLDSEYEGVYKTLTRTHMYSVKDKELLIEDFDIIFEGVTDSLFRIDSILKKYKEIN